MKWKSTLRWHVFKTFLQKCIFTLRESCYLLITRTYTRLKGKERNKERKKRTRISYKFHYIYVSNLWTITHIKSKVQQAYKVVRNYFFFWFCSRFLFLRFNRIAHTSVLPISIYCNMFSGWKSFAGNIFFFLCKG